MLEAKRQCKSLEDTTSAVAIAYRPVAFVCARDSFRYQFAASFTRAYLCFPGLQGDIDHESGKLKGM